MALRRPEIPPRIEIEVEELILCGFDASVRHRVGDAFRAELERLAARMDPARLGAAAADRLALRDVHLPGGAPPEAYGVAVARSLGRALESPLMNGQEVE